MTIKQGVSFPISTEGRIFTAQLTRDLAARQAVGAALLSPAARRWPEAFDRFAESICKTAAPTKAAKLFHAGIDRLLVAQKEHAACVVNCFERRSRSAYVEVLGFDVAKHPLTNVGNDGILVGAHICRLQRKGRLGIGFGRLAFVSWHATGRMWERSDVDIFSAHGVAGYCGVAGLLLRGSDQHANSEINLAFAGMIVTGVLRSACTTAGVSYRFFDVLTVLPLPERNTPKLAQGIAVTTAVTSYLTADSANPEGYAAKVPVLPFHESDFVSLTQKAGQ
jgi:hypothetical protein